MSVIAIRRGREVYSKEVVNGKRAMMMEFGITVQGKIQKVKGGEDKVQVAKETRSLPIFTQATKASTYSEKRISRYAGDIIISKLGYWVCNA
jgi:hypothetical protein